MNPINFLSRFSLHIPQNGKYWWCTYACKIVYMVKHLLVHTDLGLMSQNCLLSAALPLTKMRYFVFYFSKGPLGQRTNSGCSTWDEIVVMLLREVKLAEARSQ